MSINTLSLKNYRCFRASGQVPLAPLTVLLGRNSSGKSSLVQPFLLFKQTLEARGFENTLNLKGPLLNAGAYSDIVYRHDIQREIELAFGLSVDTATERRLLDYALPMYPLSVGRRRTRRVVDGTVSISISSVEPFGPQLRTVCVDVAGGPSLIVDAKGRGEGPFRPWELRWPTVRDWVAVPGPGPQGPSMFPCILERREETGMERAFSFGEETEPFNILLAYLEGYLSALHVLGPFRTRPERYYEFAGKDFVDVGLEGDHAVDALIASSFQGGVEVLADVKRWLAQTGLAEDIEVRPVGKDSVNYQLYLKVRDVFANYPDVGFGVSQVLPVLVQGLRTPERSLFICQQPEIHLHPDAQVGLADFFVDLVRRGRHVFVETHSEYLVLGLRRILAQERQKSEPRLRGDEISFVYVDDTAPEGATVRPLQIDKYGNVLNWPDGFMDQATTERVRMMDAVVSGREA